MMTVALLVAAQLSAADGWQDLVFLGDSQPVLLRLNVTIDGQPFHLLRNEYVRQLFAHLDGDRDGGLSRDEAAGASQYVFGTFGSASQALAERLSELGGANQPRIDLPTFATAFEGVAPAFSMQFRPRQGEAATGLFHSLDADQDGRVTSGEFQAAPERLESIDFDGDGTLAIDELFVRLGGESRLGAESGDVNEGQPWQPLLVLPQPGQLLADALLRRYDRDSDGRLSVGRTAGFEIWLEPAVVGTLDGDGDGVLQRPELAAFAARRPDIELQFPLGKARLAGRPNAARNSDSVSTFAVKKKLDGSLQVELTDTRINFRRNNRHPSRDRSRQIDFGQLDKDNNGYVDREESGVTPLIAAEFTSMDKNGDGRVQSAELHAYFERRNDGEATRVQLEVTDEGQKLFQWLDANVDGALSRREFQHAASVLSTHDANGDGALDQRELRRELRIVLSRGTPPPDPAGGTALVRPAFRTRMESNIGGPLWFRKMDRNFDGDVCPREFLGSREQFERLDRNSNGLIDAEEAAP